jgi:putative transposase
MEFQVDQPNWPQCSDISYLWTMQGWLYLAEEIDLYSRKVVERAM